MLFFPYFAYTAVNIANVPQTNNTFGQNIAIGSPGASQTLVQLPSNSVVLGQR